MDLLCGGVPCQSFSSAGKRQGLTDTRGNLLLSFIDLIFKLKPKIFMIENVRGLYNHNQGKTFKYILEQFDKHQGYQINYGLINANDYQVPQKRERLIIIGLRLDLYWLKGLFSFPLPISPKYTLKDALYAGQLYATDVAPSIGAKYSALKQKLYNYIPQGGCWTSLPEEFQKEYLGKSYYSSGGRRGILARLSLNKPSLTLLCSPSQKQTERCHPLENRPLNIQEYARIQTFPDNYHFSGSLSSQYRQIGNAVPVNLALIIGKSLREYLRD